MSGSSTARTLVRFAPAKINLHLRIGPPRADGFHPLLSWFTTVGLRDTLNFSLCPASRNTVRLTCSDPTLPVDGRNLVVKAAELFFHTFPRPQPMDCAIHLHKQTPAGGGLGGGSSDAAATLLALAELQPGLTAADLLPLAAQLGSDVPFFLLGPSSVCTGRGEIVRPVGPPQHARAAVLILPPIAMPTPEVYRRFDALSLGRDEDVHREPDWQAWRALPATQLLPHLVNDLEAPAFAIRPELALLRQQAEHAVHRPVRMSGSGSTLFTLFDEMTEARAAAQQLQDSFAVPTMAVSLATPAG